MDVVGVDHFGFEAEKELGAQMKNCVIASQTGRRLCRLDQINADSKQSWYRLARNQIKPLKPELNPICYLLALLGAYHFLHVSRIRVKSLTLR